MSDTTMHNAMGGVMDAVTAVANDAVKGASRWVNAQAVLVSRLADLLAARDAEWRAAVERVRESHPGVLAPAEYSVPEARVWARGAESALKSLLAAMEGK